jgi:hypothetical protein
LKFAFWKVKGKFLISLKKGEKNGLFFNGFSFSVSAGGSGALLQPDFPRKNVQKFGSACVKPAFLCLGRAGFRLSDDFFDFRHVDSGIFPAHKKCRGVSFGGNNFSCCSPVRLQIPFVFGIANRNSAA